MIEKNKLPTPVAKIKCLKKYFKGTQTLLCYLVEITAEGPQLVIDMLANLHLSNCILTKIAS